MLKRSAVRWTGATSPRSAFSNRSGGSRRRTPVGLLLALVGTVIGCGAEPNLPAVRDVVIEGPTMGTRYRVVVIESREQPIDEAALASTVSRELDRVNDLMSTYLEDSELSLFNASRSLDPYPLSAETLEVLELAQQVSRITDGAFDVTVGPLVDAWGFGPAGPRDEALPAATAEELSAKVGFGYLELDLSAGTAEKEIPELSCDLSALAKGYAVDRVAEALETTGHARYLVEVGGEVRARGSNLHDRPWRIGIESPVSGLAGGAVQRTVSFEQGALATSGDYRNFYERDGRRYSHVLDPRTAAPVTHNAASVSVFASTCAEADAWATALLVLGPEEGLELAEQEGLAAWFLTYEVDGIGQRGTSAFERLAGALPQLGTTPAGDDTAREGAEDRPGVQ